MANNQNVKTGAAAGLIGLVVGAAAGAAAIALSDEKNRKKVQAAAIKLQKEGGKTLEELKAMAHKFLEETEQEMEDTKKELQRNFQKLQNPKN